MAKINLSQQWILVTGASSGLGRELAKMLAEKENANLILTGRNLKSLQEIKKDIEFTTQRKVQIIGADLIDQREVDRIFLESTQLARVNGVINNAGLTYWGPTTLDHYPEFERIIQVNFMALMRLSLLFVDYFRKHGSGFIFNITSEAAFIPLPYQSVYSASKHAAQAFTESLYQECKKSGIMISGFAPGGIATEMLSKSGLDKKYDLNHPFNMGVKKVAGLAIQALKRQRYLTIPGLLNRLTVWFSRLVPRRLTGYFSERVYRPELDNKE